MNISTDWVNRNKHFFLLLLWPVLLLIFFFCEQRLVPEYYMYSRIDDHIPFVKEFVVPYIIWYFYIAFGFIYLGLTSKKDFYKLVIYMFVGMSVSYVIYILFPNAQNLRPLITENDIFSRVIRYLYQIDTPTNVCPSLHVFNAIAVDAALRNCEVFRKKKFFKEISFICMLSASASTVLIKQHSILDVFWGVVLAGVLYSAVYWIPKLVVNAAEKNRVKDFA